MENTSYPALFQSHDYYLEKELMKKLEEKPFRFVSYYLCFFFRLMFIKKKLRVM